MGMKNKCVTITATVVTGKVISTVGEKCESIKKRKAGAKADVEEKFKCCHTAKKVLDKCDKVSQTEHY